jgi:multidrug efflux pump subunit AcrA (membrane-fusion protein)
VLANLGAGTPKPGIISGSGHREDPFVGHITKEAGGALFIALAVLGITSRTSTTNQLQTQSNEAARTLVSVIHPEKAPTTIPLQLPRQTRAYIEAPIFAQTSGYLKKWYFEIGANVKAGDVLAEIDTPQVDQQLGQARAQLKVAEAAKDLAEVTYKRDQDLYNRRVIAAQDFDTAADTFVLLVLVLLVLLGARPLTLRSTLTPW